eukprot:TRINITY_DN26975_c0_g1_i2.p1 TRINITY_DN26975_c0_g1~~TRINITY_DN26975_c0_g1_i2.p1  ORF type:complete len:418 (-),score=87.38 TRINITY_DN26975_c0_g1_i2:85-1338(-)
MAKLIGALSLAFTLFDLKVSRPPTRSGAFIRLPAAAPYRDVSRGSACRAVGKTSSAAGEMPQLLSDFGLLDAKSWQSLGAEVGLSVADETVLQHRTPQVQGEGSALEVNGISVAASRDKIVQDGYICVERGHWDSDLHGPTMEALARGIEKLSSVGLPPQFLLAFDETWEVANEVSGVLEKLLGLRNIMDFYVFNVKPGGVGWQLHRDRKGGSTLGFSEGGLPEYTTIWIAITDASPKTSCIYVLPAYADPSYKDLAGDDSRLIVGYSHQHIRALPVQSGDVLLWSHRLLHWGSAAPPEATHSRKTLTFAMAAPGFEEPFLHLAAGEVPSFEARLALVAFTLVCYHNSEAVAPAIQPLVVEILRRHADHLTDAALTRSATGKQFLKNIMALRGSGNDEQARAVEQIGEYMWKRFGDS